MHAAEYNRSMDYPIGKINNTSSVLQKLIYIYIYKTLKTFEKSSASYVYVGYDCDTCHRLCLCTLKCLMLFSCLMMCLV